MLTTTDAELEALLGHATGIRGASFEESAGMLADWLRGYAGDRPPGARVTVHAAALRMGARYLDALAGLSREGDDE